MKIIDSSGWIEYFAGGKLAAIYETHLTDLTQLITPSIIFYEVYKRVLRELGDNAAALAASQMIKTTMVPLDEVLAMFAAKVSVDHKLPMADAIIYATAISTGATVVTSDVHFQGLPGVDYIPKQ